MSEKFITFIENPRKACDYGKNMYKDISVKIIS